MTTVAESKPKLPATWNALNEKRAGQIVVTSSTFEEQSLVPCHQKPRWLPYLETFLTERFGQTGIPLVNTQDLHETCARQTTHLLVWQFRLATENTHMDAISQFLESEVRSLLSPKENPEILFIFSPLEADIKSLIEGAFPDSYIALQRIAAYYRIPFINFGVGLWKAHMIDHMPWEELVENHLIPTDKGIAICARQLAEFLDEHLRPGHTPAKHILPAALCAETMKKFNC